MKNNYLGYFWCTFSRVPKLQLVSFSQVLYGASHKSGKNEGTKKVQTLQILCEYLSESIITNITAQTQMLLVSVQDALTVHNVHE